MSKSTLAKEVAALQGNTAFISEFLDVPIFDLGVTEDDKALTAEVEAVPTAPIKQVVGSEKLIETTTLTETPAAPVVTKVVMPKIASPQPTKRNYEGKYVIWTPGKPSQEERVLIKKIIEAVNIPAASLVLENDTNPELADWSSTPFVFAFGVETTPGVLHQLSEWRGTRLLKTCSLAELNADLNQKKALWAALKQAFKI